MDDLTKRKPHLATAGRVATSDKGRGRIVKRLVLRLYSGGVRDSGSESLGMLWASR